jgi:hypothetical protein
MVTRLHTPVTPSADFIKAVAANYETPQAGLDEVRGIG